MTIVISIVSAIVAILAVILIHELGHFFVARWCGVKIEKFSIGFGKAIWKRKAKSGIEYVIAILPLGGYVKMLGDDDGQVLSKKDLARSYNRKPLLARMAIVIAGPITNLLLAVVLFWIVYQIGIVQVKPVIGKVVAQSIAAKAGLRRNDEILKIDGTPTLTWQQVMFAIMKRMGDKGDMVVTVRARHTDQIRTRRLVLSSWHLDELRPDFFGSLGMQPYVPRVPALVKQVFVDSPAAKGGLLPGDHIRLINGRYMTDMESVVKMIWQNPGKPLRVSVLRAGKLKKLILKPGLRIEGGKKRGFLGFKVKPPKLPADLMVRVPHSFFSAWVPAVKKTWQLFILNFTVLGKMLTGDISTKSLGGSISIFHAAGVASQYGVAVYLNFIAFISVTLGFLNILPIPGLDGGHLMFQLIEAVIRRPVSQKYQALGLRIGISLIVFLMIYALSNDVVRLFGTS